MPSIRHKNKISFLRPFCNKVEYTKTEAEAKIRIMDATEKLLMSFDEETQKGLSELMDICHLTENQRLETVKNEADLRQWQEDSLTKVIDKRQIEALDPGFRKKYFIKAMREYVEKLRQSETDYSSFEPKVQIRKKEVGKNKDKNLGFGRCPCPVDGEKTRCCKLTTLDVVTQCAFSCSYCSVQSFYCNDRIEIIGDLEKKLDALCVDESIWHIGTGQASDSLLFDDRHGTVSALAIFAKKHPNIIIELKSKAKSDIGIRKWPSNMIFTWSLNAPTIIEKEEHLAASLEDRLISARKCADSGNLVGFHIHPMVYFKGWQEEYAFVVEQITKNFSSDEICMISSGTLVFTKQVLKTLREKGAPSRVLEMELSPAAGKYSYPLEIRKRMYTTLFSYFPEDYRKNVFTYLCLEDPSLWKDALGREYPCDKDFEEDMKRAYLSKVALCEKA